MFTIMYHDITKWFNFLHFTTKRILVKKLSCWDNFDCMYNKYENYQSEYDYRSNSWLGSKASWEITHFYLILLKVTLVNAILNFKIFKICLRHFRLWNIGDEANCSEKNRWRRWSWFWKFPLAGQISQIL